MSNEHAPRGGSAWVLVALSGWVQRPRVAGGALQGGLLAMLAFALLLPAAAGAASGTKVLYLTDAASIPPLQLTRGVPGSQTPVEIDGASASLSWMLTPALVAAFELDAQPIPVELWLTKTGANKFRNVQAQLFNGPTLIGTVTQGIRLQGEAQPVIFSVPNAVLQNAMSGDTLTLTITNLSPQSNERIRIHSIGGGSFSRVHLPANTIINVDSAEGYDAAYPGGAIPATFSPGDTVFVRASVSDPFGDFDITGAVVDLVDPLGATVASGPMTQVSAIGVHPKVYEFSYVVPAAGPMGIWTAQVTATEGAEVPALTDVGVGTFVVVASVPNIVVLKSMSSSPAGSYHLPGTDVVYTIRVTNMGTGPVDLDTLVITEAVPSELELSVADFDAGTSGPLRFDDGTPASGLTYTFGGLGDPGDDIAFQDIGPGYTYTPTPPYDGNVAAIRIKPKGILGGSIGAGDPYFEIRLRARVR